MGGILSGNLPVFVVENRTDGNRSYTTMHEGEGKVLRFGVYDESVGEHLTWMRDVLGVALSRALKLLPGGGLAVNPDPRRRRSRWATSSTSATRPRRASCTARSGPKLTQAGLPQKDLESVSDFLAGNINFFLTLAMASAKAALDAAATIRAGSVVTCLTRNGREFAIRVSGTGDRWFTGTGGHARHALSSRGSPTTTPARTAATAPSSRPTGWAARSPSPRRRCSRWSGTGEGGFDDALATSDEQAEIVVANNPNMPIPNWNFGGVPVGIDIRKVVATGIAPLITTAVMHKKAGNRDGRRREGARLDAVLHLRPRGTSRKARVPA